MCRRPMCKSLPIAPRLWPAASLNTTFARTTMRYGAPKARDRRSSSERSSAVSSTRRGDLSRMLHQAVHRAGAPVFYPAPNFWGAVLSALRQRPLARGTVPRDCTPGFTPSGGRRIKIATRERQWHRKEEAHERRAWGSWPQGGTHVDGNRLRASDRRVERMRHHPAAPPSRGASGTWKREGPTGS